MSSFLDKLKKGMGVEESFDEEEVEEESFDQEPVKEELEVEEPKEVKKEPQKPKKVISPKKINISEKEEVEDLKPEPEPEPQEDQEDQGFADNLGGSEGRLAVDVYQTDTELVIQSAIAGIKPEDVDISVESDSIFIKGERVAPGNEKDKNYFYQECYWGSFSRQIVLPLEADPSRAQAEMKEGVLVIRIPKVERDKKKKIEVSG